MLESWILEKLQPYQSNELIILRDPHRMVRSGARAVHGWGEEHGYTVLFCTGNLALREMYERFRDNAGVRVLLVDRSRENQLFYPDIEAAARTKPLAISLQDFLIEKTRDPRWPNLVNDRNIARLLLSNLPAALEAHQNLRAITPRRFNDNDLYRIVLGAALHINPFKQLSASEVRRLCLQQYEVLDELNQMLPEEVKKVLQDMIHRAPKPFSWLLERDPDTIILAFTLSSIMHQHRLDYSMLLVNFDPGLFPYRDIDADTLNDAMQDQLAADPDIVMADIQKVEAFLVDQSERLALLLRERLQIDDPKNALAILKNEKLSNLIRSMALASLLIDLLVERKWQKHQKNLELIERQAQKADYPVFRRPSEQWEQLLTAYRRAIMLFELTSQLRERALELKVVETDDLTFEMFDRLWNPERSNRLDFYISDLERILRIGDILPVPRTLLWADFDRRWDVARQAFKETADAVDKVFMFVNHRFQDLYHKNYTKWIVQPDSPAIFTHQFLPRLLKAHWDPRSGQKAVILVFDGLRTDAWDEFLRPVLEERFEVITSRPGSALIPTETELSRKAISAGALPAEFPIRSKRELDLLLHWLKNHMNVTPEMKVVKDDDTIASGMTVRYESKELDYIIFNFTDDNLHNNKQDLAFIYQSTVRDIIRQDVRSVLRQIPPDALVFITSDHGFTEMPSTPLEVSEDVIADVNLIKYRSVRAAHKVTESDAKNVVSFDIRALKIPIPDVPRGADPVQNVLFARPGLVFQRGSYRHSPDRYGHGGISLAECMVPMVVMGPKQQAQGVLSFSDFRQVGAMTEGEPLELEIHIRSSQILYEEGIPLSFSFSEERLPERKEFFTGVEKVYRVDWQPALPEIRAEDRERGTIELPLTAIVRYRWKNQIFRLSRTVDVRVQLDTSRLRRRLDSKLDLLMGKVPRELKS